MNQKIFFKDKKLIGRSIPEMEAMTFGRFGFDMADKIVDHNLFVNDEKKYDIRDIRRVFYKI